MVDIADVENWNEYLKLLIGLLAIMDPLAIIPTYLSLTARYTAPQKRPIALAAALTVLLTLILFTISGMSLLHVFGISLSAFRIAGGMLLLITAFEMIRSAEPGTPSSAPLATGTAAAVGIVPLAIPLLSGPGAISTVIIYASIHDSLGHKLLMSLVIGTAALLVFVVLRLADATRRWLGPTGVMAFNQIMGLIVAAIAIEFVLDGLAAHFPGFGPILHE
jgi:multiple antibiotic resistance protein